MNQWDLAAGYEPVEDAPMTRDEALEPARDALDKLWKRIESRDAYFRDEAREATGIVLEALAALSSPCACGGKVLRAKARGTVWIWPTGPPYLYRIESGNLELVPGLGADAGGQRQQVDILIIDVLPAEEAPCS